MFTYILILPNKMNLIKQKGSSFLSPAHWAGGARATKKYNARSPKKFRAKPKQAGKKKRGSECHPHQ